MGGCLIMVRPVKFKTPEEMQELIDNYFETCDNRKKEIVTKQGEVITVKMPAPYHITGLCLHLDITNETLNQYQLKDRFSEPITRAKKKCEAYAVDQLFEGNKGNKADFVLTNNFNWKNKTENINNNLDINSSNFNKDKIKEANKLLDELINT